MEPSTASRKIKRFEETGSNERILSHGPTMLLATMSGLFNRTVPRIKAIETQNFIRANCPDFISVDTHWRNNDGEWPPNSLDLNPLDYSVWSILEEKACVKPHPNVESLKRALKKAWNEITLETLIKIVDNFPKRLKACMDAKGGHFE
uniref:DDE-1 domain-containing protein n=1 Tax=Acrobeloides nanus TaxID=290746 RepID=A0A914DZ28_9BILA